jgi:hypothetical protein
VRVVSLLFIDVVGSMRLCENVLVGALSPFASASRGGKMRALMVICRAVELA